MRLSFCVGGWEGYPKSDVRRIKSRISDRLQELIGYLPSYKVESIGVSASGSVWVKVSTESYKLDYLRELAS